MDRFGPAGRRWRQVGKRRKSIRFLAFFFSFFFFTVCGYRHCPVTLPLTINQTLCAKAFITARHLGKGSVASGTDSWAISKWTERIIRTLKQRQAAVRLPWIPESDRRRAVLRVKLGCFSCLSDHRGEGEVEHFQIHTIFILFSAPLTPVWKELAVSLPAKGRFFFLFLHHSYPEQEAYRTEDHQRLQEPEQRSAVLKDFFFFFKLHFFKVKLGKPAVYWILSGL